MSQIVWKYTTVARNGDEVVTEVEGGSSTGGRLAFVRRRRISASSTPSGVSMKVRALGSSGRVSLGAGAPSPSEE